MTAIKEMELALPTNLRSRQAKLLAKQYLMDAIIAKSNVIEKAIIKQATKKRTQIINMLNSIDISEKTKLAFAYLRLVAFKIVDNFFGFNRKGVWDTIKSAVKSVVKVVSHVVRKVAKVVAEIVLPPIMDAVVLFFKRITAF